MQEKQSNLMVYTDAEMDILKDYASTLDFDQMNEVQNKILEEKLADENPSGEDSKYEIPTVAFQGNPKKVISLKEAREIEKREFKKAFCENIYNNQVSQYRITNGYEMSGQQKRVLRRKIARDYDNGKYKKYLNSNLNG